MNLYSFSPVHLSLFSSIFRPIQGPKEGQRKLFLTSISLEVWATNHPLTLDFKYSNSKVMGEKMGMVP